MSDSPKSGARGRAIDVLVAVAEGAPAQAALSDHLDTHPPLEAQDRGLCTELVYGTLRLQRRLDAWLAAASDRGLEGQDEATLAALRIGAYQLAALSRVPDFAALSATVEAAKGRAPARRIPYLNAVLRRLGRERPWEQVPLPALLAPWQERRVRAWADACRIDGDALLEAHAAAAPVHVHVTAGARDDAAARFAADGVEVARVGALPGVFEIVGGSFWSSELLRTSRAIAQDAASAAIADWLGAEAGERVLDACAGRGAKSLFLAATGAQVTALDVASGKLEAATALAEAAGCPLAGTLAVDVADADALGAALPQDAFDAALVDAPCSGLGTLRRRPEIGHRRSMADVVRLSRLQAAILRAVAARVRPGGRLVYAVCTLTEEEGPGVVADFLADYPEWQREPAAAPIPSAWSDADGALRSHPLASGADCFFAVRLRRAT
ncbi:MAG: hypothetical protein RIT45_1760 [Pseudomonadota bacterium]|jgi:16S rRNA (cytosine967-C5)-methyltransferase